MSDSPIRTRIWLEEPEPTNAFATRRAYCHGYDVYGEMLGRASWAEMVYLLFRGEVPTPAAARLLDTLAVALANPGPRDPAVHAAMCGGVGGSTAAATLSAALAVGAGQSGGAREVFRAMQAWGESGPALHMFSERVAAFASQRDDVWPAPEHAAGFDPHGVSTTTVVRETLACLARLSPGPRLPFLHAQREIIEHRIGLPLTLFGVAAAAFADLLFSPEQGEMLHLILRLPGAAVHALEQSGYGFKRFPFPPVDLTDDPGQGSTP